VDDGQIRELAHRFFDAIEARDLKTMAALYDDGLQFWFNATDRTSSKAENLAAVEAGNPRHRRRLYNERIINTFDGGFVMQYTLNITQHSGAKTTLFPCVVVLCKDGRITRIDEYIDSGKFFAPLRAAEAKAEAAS
jgi:ketosteroid isomerase-like protein